MKPLVPALLLLLWPLPARAQSINVDFEVPGTAFGLPTPNYVGPSGTPGVWNSVSDVSVSGLRRWDGAATGVSLTLSDPTPGCHTGASVFHAFDVAGTSGQDEEFLDDRYGPNTLGVYCTFQGLEPGDYLVDTIAIDHCGGFNPLEVSVAGSTDPVQLVSGEWHGAYVLGETHTRHFKTVTDGTIEILVVVASQSDYLHLSGFQLDKGEQELPGHPMCFGDGSGGDCPCANSGREGRGCQNSAGTGGAVLFASGATEPDTVVLRSSGELASALSIFLQGNASIAPVVFGDGLRCAGGTLRRLYTKSASGGEAFAPGPGDPSITVRSAQVGVPIPADGRRYYQVYYRDANPGFCPSPPGNTFNITSAVRINW